MNFVTRITNWIDRKSGLADLSPVNRRRVRALQMAGVVNMAPIGTVGAIMAMLIVAPVLWDTEARWSVLAVMAAIAVLQGFTLDKYLKFKDFRHRAEARLSVIKRIALSGMLFGGLWGAVGYLAVVYANPNWLFIIGLLYGGILLTTAYCFRTVFLGCVSFVAVSGTFLAVAFASRPEFVGAPSAIVLTLTYFLLVPRLGFHQMCDFIAHASAEVKSADDAQISKALLHEFEEAGQEWFWATDADGYLDRASDNLRNVLACVDPIFSDSSLHKRLSDCDLRGEHDLVTALKSGADFEDVRVPLQMNGEAHWISFSGRRSLDSAGTFSGYVGVCADVTKEKLAEQKIVEMAMIDGLTGLQNRTSFYESIDGMVRRLERYGTPFSMMFLDLDKFKLVNDSYGHHVGDGLLVEAASRIRSVLRDNDVVGRLGGDEFAIIVDETSDPVFIAKLASRIIQEVSAPYHVDGETLYIGVSLGVALAPVHGTQREQLLRNADLALYRAKDDGRGVFRYFEAQMDFEQRERRMLEQEMRQALRDDEFEMKFQPMISTKTGHVACMEALIRWNHSIRGLLSPDEFISIAEQSSLIVEVGRWSLQSACETALTWPESVSIAVNVSALHFMRSNIVQDVSDVLKSTELNPARLEIEITESILIEDNDETVTKLNGLRKLGVTIALDDFGTGYSSLGYLTKFRFDRLKIDKSFLMDMDTNDDQKAIVYTISTLGENLDIDITVEGVETVAHVEFLKTIYCDQAQGFYYSRPLPKEDVPGFLLKTFSEAISTRETRRAPLIEGARSEKDQGKSTKVA